MLKTALLNNEGPSAIRYPRGQSIGVKTPSKIQAIPVGESEILKKGKDILILTLGPITYRILQVIREMDEFNPTVVDVRFVKPLDEETILSFSKRSKKIITVETNVLNGGFGSAVLELLSRESLKREVMRIGIPDRFIEHGEEDKLFESIEMDNESLKDRIRKFVG
jgi:1-deoxy-D-xylulose-5-phosphate synthase